MGPALLLGTVNRLRHNIPSQLCLAIQVKKIGHCKLLITAST
jgi:hypothetical protein